MVGRFHGKIDQLSRKETDELLSTSKVGRLGLSLNDNPYVVPVSYWYSEGKIYFHSSEGKKIQYIKENPQVCFEVDEIAEDGSWKSVIAYGKVELATDMEIIRRVFEKALGHYEVEMGGAHPEMTGQEMGRTGIDMYVGWIDVVEMTGRKGV